MSRRTAKLIVLFAAVLLLLLVLTNPRELPSLVLMAPFVLLFIILWLSIASLLGYSGVARRQRIRLAALAAAFPGLLLVLQSLGQLTLRDALALFALFSIAYFYISRFGVQTSR